LIVDNFYYLNIFSKEKKDSVESKYLVSRATAAPE